MEIPNKNQDKNNLFSSINLQALKSISSCPVCKKKYQPLQANIIEETEEAYLIHVSCPNCLASTLVLILNQGPLVNSVGVVTDLGKEDATRIIQQQSVQEDDVLEVHQLVNYNKELISKLINY